MEKGIGESMPLQGGKIETESIKTPGLINISRPKSADILHENTDLMDGFACIIVARTAHKGIERDDILEADIIGRIIVKIGEKICSSCKRPHLSHDKKRKMQDKLQASAAFCMTYVMDARDIHKS